MTMRYHAMLAVGLRAVVNRRSGFRPQRQAALAQAAMAWQGTEMNDSPSRSPLGGGVLIAVGAIIGAFGGAFFGESSRGFFAGLAAGAVLAIIVWLRDRR
jgi:hypothetical protein